MVHSKLPPNAPLIGKGKQGKVYLIAPDRCIKIYEQPEHARMEASAYRQASGSPITATMHESGPDYIVIDLLQGVTLNKYLKRKGTVSRDDTVKLLSLLGEMKLAGFTRIDAAPFHIWVTDSGPWKVIDLVHSYVKTGSKPYAMLKGLQKLDLCSEFLNHVKQLDPALYEKWNK